MLNRIQDYLCISEARGIKGIIADPLNSSGENSRIPELQTAESSVVNDFNRLRHGDVIKYILIKGLLTYSLELLGKNNAAVSLGAASEITHIIEGVISDFSDPLVKIVLGHFTGI